MKYLKHFESKESPKELMLKYADDIVRVFVTYEKEFKDATNNRISEVIWKTSLGDEFANTGVLTEQMMRQVIEELTWDREIENLLNVYYECRPFVNSINKDVYEDIKEIFLEYSDLGQVNIFKTAKFNDDRYSVEIKLKDIFFKINFEEIFLRLKDIGFESYSVYGVKNGSNEYIKVEFWKPLVR